MVKFPERQPWGTALIRCSRRKCKWMGYETGLKEQPHRNIPNMTQKVCPDCGCDSYFTANEKEIAAFNKLQ
jgi:hypothetical protein